MPTEAELLGEDVAGAAVPSVAVPTLLHPAGRSPTALTAGTLTVLIGNLESSPR